VSRKRSIPRWDVTDPRFAKVQRLFKNKRAEEGRALLRELQRERLTGVPAQASKGEDE